ncbi:MAG: alpha/beta hydrolase [Bdellovibrionota bacterium]
MRARLISGLCLILLLSGCSGLFYYPDNELHVDLTQLKPGPENISFSAADQKLHGWYFHQGSGKKTRAVILFYHGNGQNVSAQFAYLHWILNYPYDFFIFDYEGYGRSSGSPSPENTVRDGEAAIAWLHAHDPKLPIVVFGQSLGGIVAQRNMIDLKGKYPVPLIILDSTFSSYKSIARKKLASIWFTWPFQWLSWLVLSDHYASRGEIANMAPTPLVVIHGDADQVVPYSCGEEIFAEAGEPKEFWKIVGGEHTDLFQHEGIKEKFLARIEKALK